MTSYTTGYQNVRGAERRRDRRLPLPIFTVRLDGVTYQTMNWSLGGLLIEGYTGDRMGGDTVQIVRILHHSRDVPRHLPT